MGPHDIETNIWFEFLMQIKSLKPNLAKLYIYAETFNRRTCSFTAVRGLFSSVLKGIWWMPWRSEAMKDVIGCDKPRRGANTR